MNEKSISVFSNSFFHKGKIPQEYTCDYQDISPHIAWASIPDETKTLMLVAYDKDIPFKGLSLFTWIHWLVYNIPPEISELNEGFPKDVSLQNGIKQGVTTFKTSGYGGPCPPFGKHRYFFRVIALDTHLDLNPNTTTWKEIKPHINSHILSEGEIYGIYSRQKKRANKSL